MPWTPVKPLSGEVTRFGSHLGKTFVKVIDQKEKDMGVLHREGEMEMLHSGNSVTTDSGATELVQAHRQTRQEAETNREFGFC